MKERKLSTDLTTAMISTFLSTVLILVTVVYCLFTSLLSIVDGKGIVAIARKTDENKKIQTSVSESLENYGISEDKTEKFLRSDAIKDVGALYGKDVLDALKGDSDSEANFTTENVQAALVSNLDELVEMATEKGMDEETVLQVEGKIVESIKKDTEKVVKKFATKKEIAKQIEISGIQEILNFLAGPDIKIAFWVTVVVICIVILILRYYNFGGFLWLGVNFVLVAVILAVVIALGFSGTIGYMFSGMMIKKFLIDTAITVFTKGMISSFATVTVVAILNFICYNFLKKLCIKRENDTNLNE